MATYKLLRNIKVNNWLILSIFAEIFSSAGNGDLDLDVAIAIEVEDEKTNDIAQAFAEAGIFNVQLQEAWQEEDILEQEISRLTIEE